LSIGAFGCGVEAPERPVADPAPAASVSNAAGAGLGNHHHPIATASADAQRHFDQGVALTFAFNHEEAVRAFQRAAELDPKAPMPHWGIAWALGPNYNLDIDGPRSVQASNEIRTARALAAAGPQVERDYVEALGVRYSPDPKADRAALARQYSAAMAALVKKYPDDLDAATLYAESLMNLRPWKLWSLDGKPAPETQTILATLESVLRRKPDHIGANHYYIHATEASRDPGRALASAKRLETLVPAAGHLVHMPAHTYARTGDHAAAAKANLAGAEADRAYLEHAPPDSFYAMAYYSHNLHFLADSEMMQGRFAEASRAAGELADRLAPHAAMMPMIESMMTMPASVLLRFQRYDDVLKLAKPGDDRPVLVAWWRFARGVALAQTGDIERARTERTALAAAIPRVPDTALFGGTGLESARTVLGIALTSLDARIAARSGLGSAAIALWTQAVKAADALPYDEPPVWFYPLRESLGAALSGAGRHPEAEAVFREDLARHPRNARSLYGLTVSLRAQQKTVDAGWVEREFAEAWANATERELSLDNY
jgi:tetratricopeptide (TPR) repeat protein